MKSYFFKLSSSFDETVPKCELNAMHRICTELALEARASISSDRSQGQ